jgi:hypothetical protein
MPGIKIERTQPPIQARIIQERTTPHIKDHSNHKSSALLGSMGAPFLDSTGKKVAAGLFGITCFFLVKHSFRSQILKVVARLNNQQNLPKKGDIIKKAVRTADNMPLFNFFAAATEAAYFIGNRGETVKIGIRELKRQKGLTAEVGEYLFGNKVYVFGIRGWPKRMPCYVTQINKTQNTALVGNVKGISMWVKAENVFNSGKEFNFKSEVLERAYWDTWKS